MAWNASLLVELVKWVCEMTEIAYGWIANSYLKAICPFMTSISNFRRISIPNPKLSTFTSGKLRRLDIGVDIVPDSHCLDCCQRRACLSIMTEGKTKKSLREECHTVFQSNSSIKICKKDSFRVLFEVQQLIFRGLHYAACDHD